MSDRLTTDVLIVGAGPAGLAAALSLKRRGYAGRVVVIDKAKAIGNHVLSGAIVDPSAFAGLLSDDELAKLPVESRVTREGFRFILGRSASLPVPWVPPLMRQHGFPIVSLVKLVRYLAGLAKAAGVEIYPGFAAVSLLEEDGVVRGVRTGEKGLDSHGNRKPGFLASEEIRATWTLLAEGAAGILTDRLIRTHHLEGTKGPSYALGIKELFEYPEPRPGTGGEILHTFGWPVDPFTYGGGCVYHLNDRQIAVIYALGLDYEDAEADPHELFRRFKAAKVIARHLEGAKPVAYGAKLIPEGGLYSVPRLQVPGAMILGDGAGLVDGLRIKGVHLAMQSGMAAAAAITGAAESCDAAFRQMNGYRELKRVRNVHGGVTYGAPVGVAMAGLAWLTNGTIPWWCFGKRGRDAEALGPFERSFRPFGAKGVGPDRLTDVFMSGTIHEESQPCHLHIRNAAKCVDCARVFRQPCTRFCPAEVYRVEEDGRLRIDFSNCLHCKTCSTKCPMANIEWTFPQGGDGPRYTRL